MATAQLGLLLRNLHRLTAGRALPQRSDQQLLEDFTAGRDEAAFAALVARHGQMVLRVCRRVLNHEQDAEDAFQASFLVLARNTGSIRKREALAQWLHGVAYRTAMEAKRRAARRRNHEARLRVRAPRAVSSPTWDDVQAVLDEEIQRLPAAFRTAFVLCLLEGRSGPEAAAELGVKEGTVSSRLTRARQRLQQQLARRGIKLAALLAALAVAEGGARAAVPGGLVRVTIRWGLWVAAGGTAAGPIPSQVAALAAGVTRAMFLMKAKIATVVLLAAGVLAGAALWAHQVAVAQHAAQPQVPDPKPGNPRSAPGQPPAADADRERAETLTYRGRVLDPMGKPVAGANLYVLLPRADNTKPPSVRATTGNDGRFEFTAARAEFLPANAPADVDVFSYLQVVATAKGYGPDWTSIGKPPDGELTLRLAKNDATIDGRILDLQGKAVAGAKVRVVRLATTAEDDLASFLKALKAGAGGHLALNQLTKTLLDPSVAGFPRTVTTDADGRFRLPGAGPERIVQLSVEAPLIEHATLWVLPRTAAEVKGLVKAPTESMMRRGELPPPNLYGSSFDHVGLPARMIVGTVRDKETGKPMAGVRISGYAVGHLGGDHAKVHTDKQGRYQLQGLVKAAAYRLTAWPGDFSTYIPGGKEVRGGEGTATVEADFEMIRGVEVRGRVTDKVTGKPVAASVVYVPHRANKHPGADFFRLVHKGCDGPGIGTFREMVPPGQGVFLVTVRGTPGADSNYALVAMTPEEQTKISDALFLRSVNALRVVDVPADAKTLTVDIQVVPGRAVSGTVLGPDGKPLTGAMVRGLTAIYPTPTTLPTARFTAGALDPKEPRQVLFAHLKKKLASKLMIRGDEKDDVTVRLEPWATLKGRILDEDGRPLAGVRLEMSVREGTTFVFPMTWWVPPRGEVVQTDRDGRFQAEGVTPGVPFIFSATSDGKFLPFAGTEDGLMYPSLGAGETKDLGDVTVKRD